MYGGKSTANSCWISQNQIVFIISIFNFFWMKRNSVWLEINESSRFLYRREGPTGNSLGMKWQRQSKKRQKLSDSGIRKKCQKFATHSCNSFVQLIRATRSCNSFVQLVHATRSLEKKSQKLSDSGTRNNVYLKWKWEQLYLEYWKSIAYKYRETMRTRSRYQRRVGVEAAAAE